MDLIERISQRMLESQRINEHCRENLAPAVAVVAERLIAALMSDHKILALGSGSAAALAQLFVSDMVNRFELERPGLAALALSSDVTVISAIASDYEFELVYSKQIRALGQAGDVLLLIAPSSDAASLVEAVHAAHERHMSVIALSGAEPGKLAEVLSGDDLMLNIASTRAPQLRECHLNLLHGICDALDFILLGGD